MRKSSVRNIYTTTSMEFCHIFFKQKAFYPHRSTITVTMTMKDDSKILIVKDGRSSTLKYKLVVKKIALRLRYATFTDKLRSRWLGSVNTLGLKRSMQATRTAHFTFNANQSTARVQSIFNYSAIPQSLLIFFQKESTFNGDYLNNRYCYKHHDLQSLKLHKSGIPLPQNARWDSMNLDQKYGVDHYYWYGNLSQMFGHSALNLNLDSFFEDVYVFCINLGENPRYSFNDIGYPREPDERRLSMITAGNLDVEFVFKNPLPQNTIAFFVGIYDIMLSWNVDGAPLDT